MTTTESDIRAAEEAIRALGAALAGIGLQLPSLALDPASCARDVPAPLIDLGRCDVRTAQLLASALREAGPVVGRAGGPVVGPVMGGASKE
ncbi:hypothetical protein [Streptomyces sp. NPDC051561]|uniref:hypothetical protein n=1 Tax=Streptomyces sp. NPDC051561 TaxID=3365658 RepID=UPI00378F9FF5